MKDKDFTTTILVDQSPAEVYRAINNVRGWWQGEITGETDKQGSEFIYQMNDVHYSKQKVIQLIPAERVEWLVTESRISFVSDQNEWLNTRICFDISSEQGKTKVTFTHQGLVPGIECYNGCSVAWGALIKESLYSLITSGKGVRVF